LSLSSQVSGFLRTYKSERACPLLREYLLVTPGNGRYTPVQRAARKDMEERFFAISTRAGTTRRVAH
jgi:hypothetical protein